LHFIALHSHNSLKQFTNFSGLCPQLVYTIERLVRGLASPRDAARLGFTLALAQIIELIPEVKFSLLVDTSDALLKAPSSAKPHEKRDAMLGKLFFANALVQSSRFATMPADQHPCIENLLMQLVKVFKKNLALRETTCTTIIALIEKVCLNEIFNFEYFLFAAPSTCC